MTTTDTTGAARNYPLPAPESDPRFTFGLLYEVAKTIEAHGYPPLTGGDVVGLYVALFGLLYTMPSAPDLASGPVHAFPPLDHPSNRTDPQPRCGAASERMALFAADVTCPPCLALMAGQNGDADTDPTDDAAIERGAQIDAAVETTGHLPGYYDADSAPDEITAERALDAYLAAYPTDGEDGGA